MVFDVHPSIKSLIIIVLEVWLMFICEVPVCLSPHPDIFLQRLYRMETRQIDKRFPDSRKGRKHHRYMKSSEIALHAIHSGQVINARWENTQYSLGCH